eukprot:TRINITY_DN39181_c0_g1_i1.p1 TRINITY_DN39181_c0_g1~~TRINITY_DN39181_c0_g1_i1.p1  ORF type:complete len:326 (+),score=25.41 TRINITY_DN39181_c0_g1_i1:70-1047(+)
MAMSETSNGGSSHTCRKLRTVPLYLTGVGRGLNCIVILLDPAGYLEAGKITFPNATSAERSIGYSFDQTYVAFAYALVFCILWQVAYFGTNACQSNLNLALSIILVYLSVDEGYLLTQGACTDATDAGNRSQENVFTFAVLLILASVHLAAVDWQALVFYRRKLFSSLTWGMWFYIVLVVAFYPYARFNPVSTINYSFDLGGLDPKVQSFMTCGAKTMATIQLPFVLTFAAIISSGDCVAAYLTERMLGVFGLVNFFVHFSTKRPGGVQPFQAPAWMQVTFFTVWLLLTWGPVMQYDSTLSGALKKAEDEYDRCSDRSDCASEVE